MHKTFFQYIGTLLSKQDYKQFLAECLSHPERNPAHCLLSKVGAHVDLYEVYKHNPSLLRAIIKGGARSIQGALKFQNDVSEMERCEHAELMQAETDKLCALSGEAAEQHITHTILPLLQEYHERWPAQAMSQEEWDIEHDSRSLDISDALWGRISRTLEGLDCEPAELQELIQGGLALMEVPADILERCARATHKVVLHNDDSSELRVYRALRPEFGGFYINHIVENVNREGVADLFVGTEHECHERMRQWREHDLELEVTPL